MVVEVNAMIQTGLVERALSGVAWPPPTSNSPPKKASNSDRHTHNHLTQNTEWHHDQLTPRVVVCKRRVGPIYTVYHKIKDVQSIKKQSASQLLGTVFAMTSGYDKWLWQVSTFCGAEVSQYQHQHHLDTVQLPKPSAVHRLCVSDALCGQHQALYTSATKNRHGNCPQ